MKKLIPIVFTLILITACNNGRELMEASHELDISDLSISSDVKQIYSGRRQKLLKKAGNGVIILRSDYGFSGGRNEFRVANNFFYLTGFSESGSLMVLKNGDNPFTFYIGPKSITDAIFTGEVPASDILMSTYCADTVLNYQDISKLMDLCISSKTPVFIDFDDPGIQRNLLSVSGDKEAAAKLFQDISPSIYEMRVKKDKHEITILRKAIDITGAALLDVFHSCKPGMYEFETEGLIEYTFRKNGSSMPAFQSIVGSGTNSVSLHYGKNVRKMEEGDLLLMDIGAEYGYYCGDISRTIPVNGKFTPEQREIYDLVLKSQKAAISEMMPGKFINTGHNKSTKILVAGLYRLGLITDTACNWQKRFYLLYPISHYLGMDVHDAGEYGTSYGELYANIEKDTVLGRSLEPGMILTVEPGLYFREKGLSQLFELYGNEASREEIQTFIDKVAPVYEKYKNIGIRIEDDVLITEEGNIVLSEKIPKEAREIERLMDKSL